MIIILTYAFTQFHIFEKKNELFSSITLIDHFCNSVEH